MTYQPLPIVEVDIDDLLLDLDNYRIPARSDDEAGAIKYLFASEDVLGAAIMILRDGYFDNEVPIAIAQGSKFIVLEGNRRVSALKALNDPAYIPGHEAEIRALLKRYALEVENVPRRIRVIVAPDRKTAEPHVARLHTGLSKRRWSLDQQATFYYSLLDRSTTVDDVKAQYPGVNVSRFIRMAVMRRFLVAAKFRDRSLHDFVSSDRLRMSAFEYAYRYQDIATEIGVRFSNDGHLEPATSTPEKVGESLSPSQLETLEYLIDGFRAGRLNTRAPEFKKNTLEHRQLAEKLAHLYAWVPGADPRNHQTPTSKTGEDPESGEHDANERSDEGDSQDSPLPTETGSKGRGPNHPDAKNTLDFSGLDYDSATLNLKLRYLELRKVRLDILPIAAAILMRAVLEATIKIHFETDPNPPTGELNVVFKYVESKFANDRSIKSSINTIRSADEQRRGSIKWFNVVAHGADTSVNAQDVRDAWKLVNPILRRLLRFPK